MEKQVQFAGRNESGIFCQTLFGSSGVFEKTAGAPPFADWETGDQLRKIISNISADQRKENAYVLVNALGAGEWFGSNINADYFPWNALTHEGDDYGYKTFLSAHAFQHHANKDHTRAFGKPIWSGINANMKRVELIIALNRSKAKTEGADGIITRIDAGEFPDVSMGCRVPFDVCSICNHRSKTRLDYCEHMAPPPELRGLYGPNKILPDGRRIYVINLTPRFFDISFVFIGADKTAKVMAKLASKGSMVCLGNICSIPRTSAEVAELVDSRGDPLSSSLDKTASANDPCCDDCHTFDEAFSVKTSEQKKLGEIIKEIPTGVFAMKKLPEVESAEPDISSNVLDRLSTLPLPVALSGLICLGIVLKPKEFQHLVLRRMGEDDLLKDMSSNNNVFKETSIPSSELDISNKVEDSVKHVLPLMRSLIKHRTVFGPSFRIRVVMGSETNNSLPTPTAVEHPLLDKISSAYTEYRQTLVTKISQATQAVEGDPKLREVILGDGLVTMFSKNASESPIVSPDSMAYLMGAYLKDRGLNCTITAAEKIAAANPELLLWELSAQGF